MMLTRDEIIAAPYGTKIDDISCKLAVSHDQTRVYTVSDDSWRSVMWRRVDVREMPVK